MENERVMSAPLYCGAMSYDLGVLNLSGGKKKSRMWMYVGAAVAVIVVVAVAVWIFVF